MRTIEQLINAREKAIVSGIFEHWTCTREELLMLHKSYMRDLSQADLTSADLTYTDLTIINLSYANLTRANLYSTDLINTNLYSADLTRANLYYADLTRANLSCADLTYADLTYADLTSANLTGTNLSCANLTSANLTNSHLIYANLSNTKGIVYWSDMGKANRTAVAWWRTEKWGTPSLMINVGCFSGTPDQLFETIAKKPDPRWHEGGQFWRDYEAFIAFSEARLAPK